MCKVLYENKRNCYKKSQTMVRKGHKLFNKFCFLTVPDRQYEEQEKHSHKGLIRSASIQVLRSKGVSF